eukprot:g3407.t1
MLKNLKPFCFRFSRGFSFLASSTFSEQPLAAPVVDALYQAGFNQPTTVQALACEKLLSQQARKTSKKVCAKVLAAETGSGKTIAYLSPIATDLLESPWRRALVLCPNQLLCEQVEASATMLPLRPAILTANVAPLADSGHPDPNLLIASPAGLLKHVDAYLDKGKQRNFVRSLQTVVLDEADLLLAGGYDSALREFFSLLAYGCLEKKARGVHQYHKKDLGRYIRKLLWKFGEEKKKTSMQFIFVAATMPSKAKKSAGAIIETAFDGNSEWITAPRLHQGVSNTNFSWLPVKAVDKNFDEIQQNVKETVKFEKKMMKTRHKAVVELLTKRQNSGQDEEKTTLIFCNSIDSADLLTSSMREAGLLTYPYHKGISTSERSKLMNKLKTNNVKEDEKEEKRPIHVVSTGIAARGLDIESVDHVIQADFAPSTVEFLHRAGRTSRAGRPGCVTSVFSKNTPEEDLVFSIRSALESGDVLEESFSTRRSFRKTMKKKQANNIDFRDFDVDTKELYQK